MTEEQFWHSNPRIIEVWEQAYKNKINSMNAYIHAWVGHYGINALTVAIDHCFNGSKARSEYIKEPIELFEKTEEEKKAVQRKELEKFLSWAAKAEKKFQKKGE